MIGSIRFITRKHDVEPMLALCWANECDTGPTSRQQWLIVSCPLRIECSSHPRPTRNTVNVESFRYLFLLLLLLKAHTLRATLYKFVWQKRVNRIAYCLWDLCWQVCATFTRQKGFRLSALHVSIKRTYRRIGRLNCCYSIYASCDKNDGRHVRAEELSNHVFKCYTVRQYTCLNY